MIKDLSGQGNDLTYTPVGAPILGGNLDAQVTAVTDSGENPPNEVAVNLKDGDPSTKWLTFNPAGWVAYQMASPVVVKAYSLTSAGVAHESFDPLSAHRGGTARTTPGWRCSAGAGFNFYPLSQTYPTTNWGQGLPEDQWFHLAVVNDGKRTLMYVEGSIVVDNPSTYSNGITSLGLPWLLGGQEYAGSLDQVFHGWIGDVRIVNRPLAISEFMTGK